MTVCVATIFRWNYGANDSRPDDWGPAALAISDRMITAGDVQYEPNQQKVAFLTDDLRLLLLIAGDYTLHSQALKIVKAQLKGRVNVMPYDAAVMYGAAIQAINRKNAEDLVLAPLGLNTDSFLAQQKDMAEHFVSNLTSQLQNFRSADVQALICGFGGDVPHLYEVDRYGSVACGDDVGFIAVGIGASHASSVLMQSGYVNTWTFASALSVAYAAKRAAETAPGVGAATDVHLVLRTGAQPLAPSLAQRLPVIYKDYAEKRVALALDAIRKLGEPFEGGEISDAEKMNDGTDKDRK